MTTPTIAVARAALAGFILSCLACSSHESAETTEKSIALQPCQLNMPGLAFRVPAECGTLEVPEDRSSDAAAGGRRISLRIGVLAAIERNASPDPLFILTGGPGQAATESIVSLQRAFRRVRRKRDIVLVDQRGTGGSNPLRCENISVDEELDFEEMSDALVREAIDECIAGFDADPRHYGTLNAAADLDAVRENLGYDEINLYGISYGTRMAATYAANYSDRVRAIVLDGVVPSPEPVGRDVARDAQRALELIFKRCEDDDNCRRAFGNMNDHFNALMARLAEPVSVKIAHPRTGAETDVVLDRRRAGLAIRLLSYSPETVALLPLLISEADRGHYEPLAAQFLIASDGLRESMADGMSYSILCSEDVPFYEPGATENAGTYLGNIVADELSRLCAQWPQFPVPNTFKNPLSIDAPVLLLSGEADPVTPPANAEEVLDGLGRARHLIAPGLGHGVVTRSCFPRIVAEFVETAVLEDLDTDCLDDVEPLAFFVSFAGPHP